MRLEARAPFHLEATVRLLQRRPTNLVDRWQDEAWERLHLTAEGPILTRVRNEGSLDQPALRLDFPAGAPSPGLRRRLGSSVSRMLALQLDTSPFFARAARTKGLAALARNLRGLRPPRYPTLFEAIGNVVPFQQVSLDAGVAVAGRLVAHYGPRSADRYAFPSPEALANLEPETLRPLGLSLTKARALVGAARAITQGELDEAALDRLETAEIFTRLLDLQGIGPWSAGLILLRGLGRLDSFPAGDVGIAKAFGRLTDVPAEELAARFGPQRGLLYFFALGGQLLDRGLIRAAP